MPTDPVTSCPECGAELPVGAGPGQCPNCLLGLGLSGGAGSGGQKSQVNVKGSEANNPVTTNHSSSVTSLGDYELLEEIGRGGMGLVYKARQKSLDRMVALKLLLFGPHASPESVKRFRAEAVATAALQHPNIVAIHEVGVHQGQHFLVMDLVEGRTLAKVISDFGFRTSDFHRAAAYVKKTAEAIHFAHERGILHRDLKPSNVLIDTQDQPRVTDFGLARRLEGESELTVSGQVLGSPNYMPPEQARGKRGKVSRRSDVYSLGAILYHALTGRPPFVGEDLAETMQQVLNAEPISPRALISGVPADLETVCLKCLEKDPAKRYATAQMLAEELGRFLEGKPVLERPVGRLVKAARWCRRNPRLAAAIGLALLSLLTGLAGVTWQWRRAKAEALVARRNAYAADMGLVQRALEQADLDRARELLDRYRPISSSPSTPDPQPSTDLRGWEWRYLWARCRSDERFTLCQYANGVSALAFSWDGQWLAARQEDGAVVLWDAVAKRPTATLSGLGRPRALAFAPRTNLLAWGHTDAQDAPGVVLWDPATQALLARFPHSHAVLSIAFSPDAKELAALAFDGNVRVWSLESRQVVADFPTAAHDGFPGRYTSVTNANAREPPWSNASQDYGCVLFSPDGRWLVIGEARPKLRLLDRATRKESVILLSRPADGVTALAFSPQGRWLAAGCGHEDKEVHLWDLAAGTNVALPGHSGWITGLAFSPDGQTLASVSTDRTLRLWDMAGQAEPRSLQGNTNEIRAVAWSTNGHDLVTGARDGSVRYWNPAAQPALPYVVSPPICLMGPTFLPDSQSFLAVNCPRGSVTGPVSRFEARWGAATVAEVERLTFLGTSHSSLDLSRDGHLLALGDWIGNIQVWDFPARRQITKLVFPGTKIFGIMFSVGGHFLTVGGFTPQGGRVTKFWDVATWREVCLESLDPMDLSDVSFHPTDRIVAVGFQDGTAAWWDLPSGKRRAKFPALEARYVRARFSPDGRLFATASFNGFLTVWDVASRRPEPIPRRHGDILHDLAFSPDSRRLMASGPSPKGVGRLWDVETGREVVTLPGVPGYYVHVGFSPDGNTLFALSPRGGPALFWSAPSWQEIRAAEEKRNAP